MVSAPHHNISELTHCTFQGTATNKDEPLAKLGEENSQHWNPHSSGEGLEIGLDGGVSIEVVNKEDLLQEPGEIGVPQQVVVVGYKNAVKQSLKFRNVAAKKRNSRQNE